MLKGPWDKIRGKNQPEGTHTDFFPQSFSEEPLVCLFASEVPKMENAGCQLPKLVHPQKSRETSLRGVPGPPTGQQQPGKRPQGDLACARYQFLGSLLNRDAVRDRHTLRRCGQAS